MKGVLVVLLSAVIIATYSLMLWSYRWAWISRFDASYWKERFEQSQWQISQSPRTIGDDGLYQYEGYALINGTDPTTLNAEVPPLGKYLIGTSILFFGNGHIYGLIITTMALGALFLLGMLFLGSLWLSLGIVTLALLDPLILSQFPLTMLDSLLLLFLLLYLILLFVIEKQTDRNHLIFDCVLGGLTLGLFAETKVPVFAPILALLGIWTIWKKQNRFVLLGVFLTSTLLAYLIPYSGYFLQEHTLADWLVVQKWVLAFYRNSNLKANTGSVLTTLLVGRIQNLTDRTWDVVNQWSPVWSVIFLLGIVFIVRILKKFNNPGNRMWIPLAITLLSTLIVFSLVPFSARYLVLVLPFLYVASAAVLQKLPRSFQLLAIGIFIAVNGIASISVFFSPPGPLVTQFSYNLQQGFFHDVYEDLDHSSQGKITRSDFSLAGYRLFTDADIQWATVTMPKPTTLPRFSSTQTIPISITYATRQLGTFTEYRQLPLVNEDGAWRIRWDWSILMDGLTSTSRFVSQVVPGRRGTLLTKNNVPVVRDGPSYLIWLTPSQIDQNREQELHKTLERLFDFRVPAYKLHMRYQFRPDLTIPVPMGVLMHPLEEKDRGLLATFPGAQLVPSLGRFVNKNIPLPVGDMTNTNYPECCSLLYTTTTYDGKDGLEKQYNEKLKGVNGGSLILEDKSGTLVRTLIKKDKQDGRDVRLIEESL